MLAGVQIQHKVNEGPLHEGPGALEESEAGPGDLGGPLEVQDAQGLPQVPVGLGLKREPGRLPPGLHHGVVLLGGAHRHAVVGEVGEVEEEVPHPGVMLLGFSLPALEALVYFFDLVNKYLGLLVQSSLFFVPHFL